MAKDNSVFDSFLNVSFWADVLSPVVATNKQTHIPLAFKSNRMRNANCSYWGYREFGAEEVIINYEQ